MPRFKQLTILAALIALVLAVAGKHRRLATSPAPNLSAVEPAPTRSDALSRPGLSRPLSPVADRAPFLAWAATLAPRIDQHARLRPAVAAR